MTTTTPSFETPGHVWPLRITPPVARRIRDRLRVDLFAVTAAPAANPFCQMAENPLLLADVLWELLQPLATERGFTRDTFEEAAWPEIDRAAEALLAAVIASFPDEKKRAGLTKIVNAQNAALAKVLDRLTPQLDQLIDAAVSEAVAQATAAPLTRTNLPTA